MFEELIRRKLRILVPDAEKLTPEMLKAGSTGYVLEAELPVNHSYVQFVGAASIPTIMDLFGGGNLGGPVGYAFLVDEDAGKTRKRWFMSIAPGISWGLPREINPIGLGISIVGGQLLGHFELCAHEEEMSDYLKALHEEAEKMGAHIHILPAKDYTAVYANGLVDIVKGLHGKG